VKESLKTVKVGGWKWWGRNYWEITYFFVLA